MAYSLTWEEKGVYCEFAGEVTAEELNQYSMEVYSDSRFDEARYQIFNFLNIEKITFGVGEMIVAAAIDKAMATANPNIRCATVGSLFDLEVLSNLYQSETSNSTWDTCFFHDVEEARFWVKTGSSSINYRHT